MSSIGADLDTLATLAEGAVSGLVTERGLRLAEHLNSAELPHLFLHNPLDDVTLLRLNQEAQELRVSLTLVTRGETQEATLLKAEAIVDAIQASPELAGGGLAHVSSLGVREDPRSEFKAADLLVLVQRVKT
jgi:hypothetical protein